MDYKKVFKSREIRLKILEALNFVPDRAMLKVQYYIKLKRKLDLVNPVRFTEKLQWYKLNYKNPILHQCVDKYSVRDYVKSKGLDKTLNVLYGVYDRVDDIDIGSLPEQFVIKTTNGGGGINIVICEDKNKFDFNATKEILKKWLAPKKVNEGREWAYNGLKPRVIVEKYLINEENPEAGISDYKFFCFNGKPEYLVIDVDRYIGHKRNFYDKKWTYLNISSDCPNFGDVMPRPKGLDEMLEIASVLSEGLPFVRVDLYYVNNQVLFGEMTFYPWSGYVQFNPDEFDLELGEKFNLPKQV